MNAITSKQASLLSFVTLATLAEDPQFGGTHDSTEVVDGALQLKATGDIDGILAWDAIAQFDQVGSSTAASGTYRFAAGIDLGSIRRVRLTSRIRATIVNPFDLIDQRLDVIDGWADIDGVDGAPGDAVVWARLTDDDPAGNPVWSAFTRIDAQEVETRAIGQIECRLTMQDPEYQIVLSELRLTAETIS